MTPINAGSIQVITLSKGQKTQEKRGEKYQVVIDGLTTLQNVVDSIRTSRNLEQHTVELREKLHQGGREGPYKAAKLKMPAIVPAAKAPSGTLLDNLPPAEWHNGLYGYDIDENRETLDLPSLRNALTDTPGAVMVGTSCAGDALYAFFAGAGCGGQGGLRAPLDRNLGGDADSGAGGERRCLEEPEPDSVHGT